jgi:3-oxoacyl-[acyl-carrier protein] reductase
VTSAALVIGGRGGLGSALVRALDEAGIALRFTSRSESPTTDDRRLLCDIDDPASVQRCVARAQAQLGTIGALVVMSGTMSDGLLISADPDSLDSVIRTNLLGPALAVRAILPHFVENRYGRIVLVGSASGLRGSPGQASYAASKSGLVGLARSVTLEYARRGITCNVVAPGFIEAGMTTGMTEKRRTEVLRLIPAARMGRAEEVARAVCFLIGGGSGYISGAILNVDGGYGMGY